MKLIIILNEPYPYGMACTNRIQLYAKGLVQSGWETKIIIPKPKITSNKNKVDAKGVYEGIDYRYTNKSPYRSSSFIKRRIEDLTGPIRAAKHCAKEKPDSILLVGGLIYHILLFKTVSIFTRSRYLREKSEVPYMELDRIGFFKKLYLKITFSLFDGIITITDELANYFKSYLNLNIETYTVPILIDKKQLSTNNIIPKEKKYILYTGSLIDRKDGILTILNAFSNVLSGFNNLELIITGNAKGAKEYNMVLEVIENLGIKNHVRFTGFISKEQLNDLMKNAKLLVLVKPENRQNRYNFPTKIGEYLASGTPVLCTENKTINTYFNDNENMYICKNDIDIITYKINHILNNPDDAKRVGENGKKYANKKFNYIEQMRNLTNFI